jgi:hypothetical protein
MQYFVVTDVPFVPDFHSTHTNSSEMWQVDTDVPQTHQYLATTLQSHPTRPWSAYFSTSHPKAVYCSYFQELVPSASKIPKMGAVKCNLKYILILTLLVQRLQSLTESGMFQDSAQQGLQTSTAGPHKMYAIFCSFSALLFMLST